VIHRLVLDGPLFQHYFEKVEVSNFEVASDAFSTFKVAASPISHWIALSCDRSEVHIALMP